MSKQLIAKEVKILRKQYAWSQALLAKNAGVSLRTIQRLERDGHCSDETLLAVAGAFNIDVHELTKLYGRERVSMNQNDAYVSRNETHRESGISINNNQSFRIAILSYNMLGLIVAVMIITAITTVVIVNKVQDNIESQEELERQSSLRKMRTADNILGTINSRYRKNLLKISDHINDYDLIVSGYILTPEELVDYQTHMGQLKYTLKDLILEDVALHEQLIVKRDILLQNPHPFFDRVKIGQPNFELDIKLNLKRTYGYEEMISFHIDLLKEQIKQTIIEESEMIESLSEQDLAIRDIHLDRAKEIKKELEDILTQKQANLEVLTATGTMFSQRLNRFTNMKVDQYPVLLTRTGYQY